jgi:hypothetical protein
MYNIYKYLSMAAVWTEIIKPQALNMVYISVVLGCFKQ